MSKLIDTTTALGDAEIAGHHYEVCAEAVGTYDHEAQQLHVDLRCFLRALDPEHIGEAASPAWLPASQAVRESVAHDEASDLAKEVFASWKHRVQAAIPKKY